MPYARFPQGKAGNQKQTGGQGKQAVVRPAPAQKAEQGIVLNQCVRHHKGAEPEYSPAIDADRVFSVFPRPVRKNIHKLQPFHCKKADRGIDKENAGKHGGAANEHENNGDNFPKGPADTAYRKSVDKHNHSLQDAADTAEFYAAAEHLEDFVSGTDHDAVKLAIFYNGRKSIKSPGEGFGQRKFHKSNAEAQQDFIIGKSLHGGKSPEHEIHA